MTPQGEERRSAEQPTIVAISRDEPWLHFAEKTLRRTDEVQVHKDLDGVGQALGEIGTRVVAFVSSELVPARIKEFQAFLDEGRFWKVWVLKEPHDDHQRINDKHLKEMGVSVTDRPDNSKAFRRLLKIVFG
ncbi:MAG: hypothetical protein HUU16_15095 [Candidatus Omnitrophica bacterium]|nr:hypothetical protein [bacterium]NUN97487.1 hypothetical protein [Candidatus Omnitrophota bacterium]